MRDWPRRYGEKRIGCVCSMKSAYITKEVSLRRHIDNIGHTPTERLATSFMTHAVASEYVTQMAPRPTASSLRLLCVTLPASMSSHIPARYQRRSVCATSYRPTGCRQDAVAAMCRTVAGTKMVAGNQQDAIMHGQSRQRNRGRTSHAHCWLQRILFRGHRQRAAREDVWLRRQWHRRDIVVNVVIHGLRYYATLVDTVGAS